MKLTVKKYNQSPFDITKKDILLLEDNEGKPYATIRSKSLLWLDEGDIVNLTDFDFVQINKRAKNLEVGDKVMFGPYKLFSGTIKKITRKYTNAWDWCDSVDIENCKNESVETEYGNPQNEETELLRNIEHCLYLEGHLHLDENKLWKLIETKLRKDNPTSTNEIIDWIKDRFDAKY